MPLVDVILIGSASAIFVAILCFIAARRCVYNVFDPVIVLNVSIPMSAAFLAVLCAAELVGWNKYVNFLVVLLGYLAGLVLAGHLFSKSSLRETILHTLARFGRIETNGFLFAAVALTAVVAYFGIDAGAGGDARQAFARAFRPLVLLQGGMFLTSLILLLSPSKSKSEVLAWLIVFVFFSMPFSGKSIFFPILYWVGLKLFLLEKRVTLATAVGMIMVVFGGVALMGMFAYGSSSFADTVFLFFNRIWMSGDTYTYAYQTSSLDMLRDNYHVSFFSYMFHPITSLVGIRGYDKPLGSMLASEFLGRDVITGPNPHLPVVLEFFFPDNLAAGFGVATIISFLVMGARPLAVYLRGSRFKFLSLMAITLAIFCPAPGFLDTSQFLISGVGVLAIGLLAIGADLILPKRRDELLAPAPS